jgi:hypothetical protein
MSSQEGAGCFPIVLVMAVIILVVFISLETVHRLDHRISCLEGGHPCPQTEANP